MACFNVKCCFVYTMMIHKYVITLLYYITMLINVTYYGVKKINIYQVEVFTISQTMQVRIY